MRCEDVRQSLSLIDDTTSTGLLETLETVDPEEIERHIVGCPDCRVFREFLRYLRTRIDHLPQAVPPPGLAARIRTAFAAGPDFLEDEGDSGQSQKEPPKMPHILVVDDEPNIVRLMQVNLERQGYRVQTANNGAQALSKIREERPAMLISDVMMPVMDGFELLTHLRADPSLADLPILMLTAKTADADILGGYQRGADMYLTKPFNPIELINFVKRILAASSGDTGESFRI